jgi:hypothetical protein
MQLLDKLDALTRSTVEGCLPSREFFVTLTQKELLAKRSSL